MSFRSDTRHHSVPLTKTEAGTGVTMTRIDLEDSDDGVSQWRDKNISDLISIWG